MSLPPEVRMGCAHFNLGEYFEAHEAWEEHWGKGPREERELTLGLIKAAVALHHLDGGNAPGFLWQAKEAIPRLREHEGIWPLLETAALADALESLVAQVRLRDGPPQGWERPILPL